MRYYVTSGSPRALSRHRTLTAAKAAAKKRAKRSRKKTFDVVEITVGDTGEQHWLQGTMSWQPDTKRVEWSPV